jgi:hypothetical protein
MENTQKQGMYLRLRNTQTGYGAQQVGNGGSLLRQENCKGTVYDLSSLYSGRAIPPLPNMP